MKTFSDVVQTVVQENQKPSLMDMTVNEANNALIFLHTGADGGLANSRLRRNIIRKEIEIDSKRSFLENTISSSQPQYVHDMWNLAQCRVHLPVCIGLPEVEVIRIMAGNTPLTHVPYEEDGKNRLMLNYFWQDHEGIHVSTNRPSVNVLYKWVPPLRKYYEDKHPAFYADGWIYLKDGEYVGTLNDPEAEQKARESVTDWMIENHFHVVKLQTMVNVNNRINNPNQRELQIQLAQARDNMYYRERSIV